MQTEEPDSYDGRYRLNVCMVLRNEENQVLIAKRLGRRNWWQFPQGGVKQGEAAIEAMYRELYEEVGLKRHQVRLVAQTPRWLRYRLPPEVIPFGSSVIGQKQRWFLLELRGADHAIDLGRSGADAEFEQWMWVDFWEPLRRVVDFKRHVYRDALEYLSRHLEDEVA